MGSLALISAGSVGAFAVEGASSQEDDKIGAAQMSGADAELPPTPGDGGAVASDPEEASTADSVDAAQRALFSAPVASAAPTGLEDPISVFEEHFEGSGVQTLMPGMGGAQYSTKYSADTYWGYPNRCNGIILSYNSVKNPLSGMANYPASNPQYGTCDGPTNWWSWSTLRAQAKLLGELAQAQGQSWAAAAEENRSLTGLSSGWWNNNDSRLSEDGWLSVPNAANPETGNGKEDKNFRGMTQFKSTATEIHLDNTKQPYRYLATQLNVATTACPVPGENYVAPLLGFQLFDAAGKEYNLFDDGRWVNTCTHPTLLKTTIDRPAPDGTSRKLEATCGRVSSEKAIPWYGPSAGSVPNVGMKITNHQQFTGGNDSSLDALGIIDVTPLLYKSFASSRVKYGETTQLTFTVKSRSDLSYKGESDQTSVSGWEFTDALPKVDGVELETQGDATVTAYDVDGKVVAGGCSADVTTGTSLSVTNGVLKENVATCEITIDVTATDDSTCPVDRVFKNQEEQFKSSDGSWNMKYVDFVEGDTVEFYGTGEISWEKVDSDGNTLSGAEFRVTGPDGFDTVVTELAGQAGQFKLEHLEYGEYTVTEVKAPTGYEVDRAGQTVTVAAGSCPAPLTFTNTGTPLDIVKTFESASVDVDGVWSVVYDVTVSNLGETASGKYTLTDTIRFGEGINVTEASWEGPDSLTGTWTLPDTTTTLVTDRPLAASSSESYTVTVKATIPQDSWETGNLECKAPGTSTDSGFLNEATITYPNGEATDEDCGTPSIEPLWTLKKESDPKTGSTVSPGQTVTYTLTATNIGEKPVSGARAIDDMSDVLNNATLVTPLAEGLTLDGTDLVWDIPYLSAGKSASVSYKVVVKDQEGSFTLNNVVAPEGPGGKCAPEECDTTHPGGKLPTTGAQITGVALGAAFALLVGGAALWAVNRRKGKHTA